MHEQTKKSIKKKGGGEHDTENRFKENDTHSDEWKKQHMKEKNHKIQGEKKKLADQ